MKNYHLPKRIENEITKVCSITGNEDCEDCPSCCEEDDVKENYAETKKEKK